MTGARHQLAIAELTAVLSGAFDLPTVLDTVAHDARRCLEASSAAVVLLDDDHQVDNSGIQVVAEALREPTDADLGFMTMGPALVTARDGAVTMITDLADAGDTRWPLYRRDALRAGMRGMRAFPVSVLGTPVGALVIHTAEPWGVARPNDLGQTLANLTAIAVSIAPHDRRRRSDVSSTISTLLQGTTVTATAIGIIAELSGSDVSRARLTLNRLARAYGRTVTGHAEAIVAAYDSNPDGISRTDLLDPPTHLPPPHIGSPAAPDEMQD